MQYENLVNSVNINQGHEGIQLKSVDTKKRLLADPVICDIESKDISSNIYGSRSVDKKEIDATLNFKRSYASVEIRSNWSGEILDLSKNAKPLYDCIVLDLDGTLVFASEKKKGIAETIKFKDMHGNPMELWVHKRPGFDTFLKTCFESAIVGVWSMGQPGYVEAIVSLFPQKPAFVYNWCDCDRLNGKIFKRLNNIPYEGKIIMIDDKTDILEMCDRVNTFIVPEWHPRDDDDTTLYDLSGLLFQYTVHYNNEDQE